MEPATQITGGTQMSKIIGLINPGAMGASVGAAAANAGNRVLWASQGRSEATRKRAERGALEDCATVARMAETCEILLSVCPPHAAEEVAAEVAGCGFKGILVDGNAISPARTRRIAAIIEKGGGTLTDGGIIGGPAWQAGSGTTFYLSGEHAGEIAACFAGSPLRTSVIGGGIGAASALKMCYAANTKGGTALMAAILAVAEKEGVRADLEKQWGEEATRQNQRRVLGSTGRAWRFTGEMREISATFADAGIPGGFHAAAAELFERLSGFKDTPELPAIEAVLERLLKRQG
jgi:3-hydroxyisobutyrate dehydrogenase-like beta-hydroxyacid dehydrogenase